MAVALVRKMDRATRLAVPFATTLVCAVLAKVPQALPDLAPIAPVLPLVAVYFWTIFQPRLLPPVAAFAAGLLYDAVTGQPFGLYAGLFTAVHWLVSEQHRHLLGQTVAVLWASFALIAAATIGSGWLLAAIFHWSLADPLLPFCQAAATGFSFPPLFWLLSRCEAVVVER